MKTAFSDYKLKNGKLKIFGQENLVKIDKDAYLELIKDYQEKTNDITDKNELVRRMGFIQSLKHNTIF
jgi:hypothetical protein